MPPASQLQGNFISKKYAILNGTYVPKARPCQSHSYLLNLKSIFASNCVANKFNCCCAIISFLIVFRDSFIFHKNFGHAVRSFPSIRLI